MPYQIATQTFGTAGAHLLITGGVHGDEWEPMAACRQLIERLPQLELFGRVTVAPVVNEPAFLRAQRTADDGLDLARTCPGNDTGSITQQVAAALTQLIHTADWYIDLHTAGSHYQLMPLAGYVLHPDLAVLDTQRRMAHAFGLPTVWGTNARHQGRSLSVARDGNIPAIYVENGGGAGCSPSAVDQCVEGCLNVARLLGVIAGEPTPATPVYVVEDDRDQSGHLQAQLTSPADGFFEPVVSLGQVVGAGQLLGTVVDVLGQQRLEVHSPDEGLVLFLRTTPSVRAGDPLAALLPIDSPGARIYPR
jgi:predicted deacylase